MVFFELFSPTVGVLLFGMFILFIINLFYRFLINQNEAGRVKDRVKEIGDEMKKYRGDKEKSQQLLSEMMRENSKIMKMSLKPMLISFIIVLVFLPFLSVVYGDHFVKLDNNSGNVTIDNQVFDIKKDGAMLTISGSEKVTCEMPCRMPLNTEIKSQWNIKEDGEKIKFERIIALLPFSLPFFNDDLSWISWYVLISIPTMIIMRRAMGIRV
mgnify:CR=1 FL=1